jgi:predicted secreted protein
VTSTIVFYISIFLVIWWTVLFMILPLGVQSHHEAGIEVPGGGDPGSPVNPNLKKKFLTTTWISLGLTFLVWVVLFFHLIKPPPPPGA